MNRFEPTTTSKLSGRVTKYAVAASTSTRDTSTSPYSRATSSTTSSQNT